VLVRQCLRFDDVFDHVAALPKVNDIASVGSHAAKV
jgi:hypothetical protein